jgi:hypothetical protein
MNNTVNLLVSKGMPRGHAQIVVDLGTHGANEAMKALQRVVDSAPKGIETEVIIVALMILESKLDSCKELLEKFTGIAREGKY